MDETKRLAYVEIAGEPRIACLVPSELAIKEKDECVVDDNRVLELGQVVALEETRGDVRRDRPLPVVLRRATLQDKAQTAETGVRSKMAMSTCAAKVEKLKLPMRLIRVRYSFDRSLVRVVFGADERVDFRELVRELSEELRARVEMRQVGVRDEAGMAGGLGTCGRVLCCASWLHGFESVNVKMAKTQQISLNPVTIGGACGRLKCCLRYEFDCYRDLAQKMPREGSIVRCATGQGMVLARDILGQRLQIRLEDDRVVVAPMGEIEVLVARQEPAGRKREDEEKEEIEEIEA